MAIDELIRVLRSDVRGTPVAWEEVESRLGTLLPADYKAFVDRYGTGAIGDFLWVLTPGTTNRFLNLFDKGNVMLEGYRQLRTTWPREYPFATYPEKNGLLPWGVTDNGDELYWRTIQAPEHWPTVVISKGAPHEEFQLPLGDLVAGWITGRIRSAAFAELGPSFTPL
jgi:hypothetical protein